MSEMAKAAREANKDKAKRLASADPHQKVDASDWTPPAPLDTAAKTGARPVSRQVRKRGGKVQGEAAAKRADRKPRKSGGKAIAQAMINRDVKAANEDREGPKHDGGWKRGGRAHRGYGGTNVGDYVPANRLSFQNGESRMSKAAGLKRGGKVHADEAEDMKLLKREVKDGARKRAHRAIGGGLEYLSPALMLANAIRGDKDKDDGKKRGGSVSDGTLQGTRPTGGRMARSTGGAAHEGRGKAHWIKGAVKHKGALHRALHVPEGEKIPPKKIAKAANSSNPHLARKARLAETLERMPRKAGGRTKGKGGKMNVNIIIGASPGGNSSPPSSPMGPGAAGPAPRAVPVPPPQPPMPPMGGGLGAAVPMPMPPPGAMPRKRGGRTVHMDAGAGSGEGRLEKVREYGRNA